MTGIEDEVLGLLNQKPAPESAADYIEVGSASWKLKTKKTVGYIVGATVIDKNNHVLLVREAKASCRGSWYLPLGRLEPGETLVEGACREVKEEAGVELHVTSVSSVEVHGGWLRIVFSGSVTGELKTYEQRDDESLEAKFYDQKELKFLNLRCKDILPSINIASSRDPDADDILPLERAHSTLCYRCLILARSSTLGVRVLCSSKDGTDHLPVLQAGPDHELVFLLRDFFTMAFESGAKLSSGSKLNVLAAIEFCGKPKHVHDGMLLTVVQEIQVTDDQLPATKPGFSWSSLSAETNQKLLHKYDNNHFIALMHR